MTNRPPSAREMSSALHDGAVRRVVWRVVRDQRMRRAFVAAQGSVEERVETLRGPHYDPEGHPYFLSSERVRSIVYNKGER